jgi:protein disulfide-isomerase
MRGFILHAVRVSMCTVFLTTSTAYAADMVPWVQDINTARQIATARNQLILLHFFSNNCPPCRGLEENVFSQPGFGHGVARSYVPVKINVSVSPDLARQFNVDRWPLDVVITATGQEIHRMVSPQDGNEYLRILNQVAWRVASAPPGMDTQVATRGFQKDQPRSAVASVSDPRLQLGAQPGGQITDQPVPNAATLPRIDNVGPYFSPTVSNGITVGQAIVKPVADDVDLHQSRYAQSGLNVQPQVIENQYMRSAATTNATQAQGERGTPTSMPPRAAAAPPATATITPSMAAPASGSSVTASAQATNAPAVASTAAAKQTPRIGMEGYCPVTMIEEDRWVPGDKRSGARHRGRI